ncbi:hypothetical protein CCACVL1_06781 [Corchorus capsularis]|uniref:SHSP domain-containing protein n=1 Tax=Corchorus capsularis TaxID=210143 RepID=A0A1R3JD29_COCAP|nr:hypothetical protein CCACVL1_06781 [Corchorus capsularis]
MANLKESSRRWPSHTAEKFVPTSFWTEDDKPNDVLHIHLPGFKHDEVRIELPSDGHIKIEGERIVNESKCIYIDQTFPLPENPDVDNIVGKFEAVVNLVCASPKGWLHAAYTKHSSPRQGLARLLSDVPCAATKPARNSSEKIDALHLATEVSAVTGKFMELSVNAVEDGSEDRCPWIYPAKSGSEEVNWTEFEFPVVINNEM